MLFRVHVIWFIGYHFLLWIVKLFFIVFIMIQPYFPFCLEYLSVHFIHDLIPASEQALCLQSSIYLLTTLELIKNISVIILSLENILTLVMLPFSVFSLFHFIGFYRSIVSFSSFTLVMSPSGVEKASMPTIEVQKMPSLKPSLVLSTFKSAFSKLTTSHSFISSCRFSTSATFTLSYFWSSLCSPEI